MPELDGYETTRRIRSGKAGERYLKIPVIAMTANAMKGDKEKCLQVGMDDYLTKPLARDAIVQALSTWLAAADKGYGSGGELVSSLKVPEKILLHLPGSVKSLDFKNKRPESVENPKIYLKALSLYVRQGQDVLAQLCSDTGPAPMEQVGKLVHAVKGTSGNLGMYRVYEQAQALEQQYAQTGCFEQAEVEQFCHQLEQSMNDARQILQLNTVAEPDIQARDYVQVK